ncbi:MAG TPA: DUF3303 family protein [Bryobacteraceae bacterium]|nr:DUF3303 family protein [Bryobacteraceae bacterium]
MLYMVIERFKNGGPQPVADRFKQSGRMLPDGLSYVMSWVETSGARCFQLMETSEPGTLQTWMRRWDDLVEFEVVPVLASTEFWAQPQFQ